MGYGATERGAYSPLPSTGQAVYENGWSKRCRAPYTEPEIEQLCHKGDYNISVACGFGGMIAIDVDSTDSEVLVKVRSVLPPPIVVKFGSKGETLFYQDPTSTIASHNFIGKDEKLRHPPVLHILRQKIGPQYPRRSAKSGNAGCLSWGVTIFV